MWILVGMTGWLVVSSVMDIRSRRLPIWMLALGGGLSVASVLCQESGYVEILRGVMPGLMLLVIAFATKKAGYGDGIVLAFLGMVLGREKGLLLFGLGLFLAAFCSLVLLALRKDSFSAFFDGGVDCRFKALGRLTYDKEAGL